MIVIVLELCQLVEVEMMMFFDFSQKVLFLFVVCGEGFIKLVVMIGKWGVCSVLYSYFCDEVMLILKGEVVLCLDGCEYYMIEGSVLCLLLGVVYEVEVLFEEWVVVVVYCDECQFCVLLYEGKLR